MSSRPARLGSWGLLVLPARVRVRVRVRASCGIRPVVREGTEEEAALPLRVRVILEEVDLVRVRGRG